MTECFVCIETYNKSKHRKVTCPYCKYEACRVCWKRFILDSVRDPHCMQCTRSLSREILDPGLTKTWVNKDLKEHREVVLMDREKALLPETQPHVERRIKAEKYQEKINAQKNKIWEAQRKVGELQRQLYRMRNQQWRLRNGMDENAEVTEEKKERRRFIRGCPQENCRGFLSTAYKCGICETWVCSSCLAIKEEKDDENHTCDPNDVATAEFIKSQVKSCPQCGMGIQKVSGCSQMFCTDCHIAFSWTTGEIVHGAIHNPHYFEWRNRTGGNNGGALGQQRGPVPCGGLPHYDTILNYVGKKKRIPKPDTSGSQYRYYSRRYIPKFDPENPIIKKLSTSYRLTQHIQDIEIRNYQPRGNIEAQNLDLRIKYLMSRLGEDDWKKQLQRREKAREKNMATAQVLDMYVGTMRDLFNNMLQADAQGIDNIFGEMESLREYVNTQFNILRKRYNNVAPCISNEYKWTKK